MFFPIILSPTKKGFEGVDRIRVGFGGQIWGMSPFRPTLSAPKGGGAPQPTIQ
jgi:hypothetical protein